MLCRTSRIEARAGGIEVAQLRGSSSIFEPRQWRAVGSPKSKWRDECHNAHSVDGKGREGGLYHHANSEQTESAFGPPSHPHQRCWNADVLRWKRFGARLRVATSRAPDASSKDVWNDRDRSPVAFRDSGRKGIGNSVGTPRHEPVDAGGSYPWPKRGHGQRQTPGKIAVSSPAIRPSIRPARVQDFMAGSASSMSKGLTQKSTPGNKRRLDKRRGLSVAPPQLGLRGRTPIRPAELPPSTGSRAPLTKLASGEASNSTAAAISFGVPAWLRGLAVRAARL